MTREEAKDRLEQSYNDVYEQYAEQKNKIYPLMTKREYSDMRRNESRDNVIKKEMKFVWTFSKEMNMQEEPACYVVELAISGVPVAYMDATRHNEFKEKYRDICPEYGMYALFQGPLAIDRYESTIREYMCDFVEMKKEGGQKNSEYKKQLQLQANQEARNRWRREREKIFCGPTGEYEEIVTWKWLEKVVFPFATRDIWESLREFFSPDAFIPPEDIAKFNEIYNKYSATMPMVINKTVIIENRRKEPLQNSTEKEETVNYIKSLKDGQAFAKKLLRKTKRVTRSDMLYAFFAELYISEFEDDIDKSLLQERITEIFNKAEEAKCIKLISDLKISTSDIDEYWQVIKRILMRTEKVSNVWESIIDHMLTSSLRTTEDCSRLWIGLVSDLGLYRGLIGENFAFWLGFPEDNVIRLINILQDLQKEYNEDLVSCVYDTIYQMRNENEQVMRVWIRMRREWIQRALRSDNKYYGANQIRIFRTEFCGEPKDVSDFIDAMYACMYEMNNEKIEIGSSITGVGEKFVKSSETVERPINSLIEKITDEMNNNEEKRKLYTVIKKDLQDIGNKFAYFVETWKNM